MVATLIMGLGIKSRRRGGSNKSKTAGDDMVWVWVSLYNETVRVAARQGWTDEEVMKKVIDKKSGKSTKTTCDYYIKQRQVSEDGQVRLLMLYRARGGGTRCGIGEGTVLDPVELSSVVVEGGAANGGGDAPTVMPIVVLPRSRLSM